MRLKDKVAIITGGGTGIGRGIAIIFAREGAKVVICGRRTAPLEETVAQIKGDRGEAIFVQADVSDSSQVNKIVDQTLKTFGRVDILVNNAGVYFAKDAVSLTEEEWDRVMGIDLKGVWLCSKAVLPYMLKVGRGKIVNIASIAGFVGFGQSLAYCSAKGGVINMTRQMALDYAKRGVNVNAIAPGVVESEMTKPYLADQAGRKSLLDQTPVGRVGQPEDIAWAAVYLACPESDFVTGHALVVDGGWMIR